MNSMERMRRINTIHFVGIGGSGMGGIAEVLLNLGYRVQGSDLKKSAVTQRLEELGAHITQGHAAENVAGADVVVVSTAVSQENPEVARALQLRLPVVPRAEMLGELMRFRSAIAVAGTHGKTTTTSLIASVLAEGGEDPTFVIGGRLKSAGTNARLGAGRYLVAEADESDASFLHLQPLISVVTNIDNDHLGTHDGDFNRLRQSFVDFLHNLPFYGLAVLCVDDAEVRGILPKVGRPITTYGFEANADIRAVNVQRQGLQTSYEVLRPGKTKPLAITVNLPGRHNVLNSLAAVAVASELGIDDAAIQRALAKFQGVDRRLQFIGTVPAGQGEAVVIDDYGHHPVEIRAVLSAAREGAQGRVIAVAQPHRFTRLRDHMDDFQQAFNDADMVFISPVYAAGEAPIEGIDSEALVNGIKARGHRSAATIADAHALAVKLAETVQEKDMVVCLGAGDITKWAAGLADAIKAARA